MVSRPPARVPFTSEAHDAGRVFLWEGLAPATLFSVTVAVVLVAVTYGLPALIEALS